MIEKCTKCNTSFKIDTNLITSNLKIFQCSICGHEWPAHLNNKNSNSVKEKVEKDLEAIRAEIKKKTDILSNEVKTLKRLQKQV